MNHILILYQFCSDSINCKAFKFGDWLQSLSSRGWCDTATNLWTLETFLPLRTTMLLNNYYVESLLNMLVMNTCKSCNTVNHYYYLWWRCFTLLGWYQHWSESVSCSYCDTNNLLQHVSFTHCWLLKTTNEMRAEGHDYIWPPEGVHTQETEKRKSSTYRWAQLIKLIKL